MSLRRKTPSSGRAAALAAAIVAVLATGAVAAITASAGGRADASARAGAAVTNAATRGPRGTRGHRGHRGPSGQQHVTIQAIAINWQNGHPEGRDTAAFIAPGIGLGEVVCRPDTKWVRFFPFDLQADTVMWTIKTQPDGIVQVRRADKTRYSGPDFFIGLNKDLEQESAGALTGLISTEGNRDSDGGPGLPPTSFHIVWHWKFDDGYGPRCYVAGTVVTKA